MNPQQCEVAARTLATAEATRRQIGLLSEAYPDMTMDDAYAVHAAWVRLKREAGDARVGWKIGLTSRAMQAALSIDIPDSGVLLKSMVFASGAQIPVDRFIQPRIEAELAFVMKASLSGNPTHAEILAATDYVVPALEILDTRILRKSAATGRLRTVLDTIADNAANAGVVIGEPILDFASRDLGRIGAVVSRNGDVEETGLGAGVLGDPLISVAWLAERLARYGAHIAAGELILSGSFIRPIEAPHGSQIIADYGRFGRVECHF